MIIRQIPDPILRKKARPVENLTPKIINIIREMIKVLKKQENPKGVGLAAPQVGYLLQIFLIYPPAKDEKKMEVFINPKIIEKKGIYDEKTEEKTLEGCLSLHGYYGLVKRADEVTVEYQTFDLNSSNPSISLVKKTFTGFPAVIIQHEIDHLVGKLFVDHLLEQKGKLYKICIDNKTQKENLEEVTI